MDDSQLLHLLKSCAKTKDLLKGTRIHAYVLKKGLLKDNVYIANSLVNMYAKCGVLDKAQQIFDELPFRTLVSWTALIGGYASHGLGTKALACFDKMRQTKLVPCPVTFVCALKACGSIKDLKRGKQLHSEIVRENLLGNNVVLGTALVNMYVKCGYLSKAQEVFDNLPVRNEVSFNSLIAGYAHNGLDQEALQCYEQMLREGISPGPVTFSCILKACGNIGAVDKGKEIHDHIIRKGFLEKNVILGTALVDMYAKCRELLRAQQVFDQLTVRNVVSWNVLISCYGQLDSANKALECFNRMEQDGYLPDAVTFSCVLNACGILKDSRKGSEVHAEIMRRYLACKSIVLGTALIDMYAKCGELQKAQEAFSELPVRTVVSWNALLTAYTELGHNEEVLRCFEKMQSDGITPDAITYTCLLKACGNLGAEEQGEEIHSAIIREGIMPVNSVIGNAVVDLYSKCGELSKAQQVFDELTVRDVVAWTSLITGYVQLGKHDHVFETFNKMREEGVKPDQVTFTVVLTACGHLGLLMEGQRYFEVMNRSYGIIPTQEHYTCMVGLFGGSGHFSDALSAIKRMPSDDYLPAWFSLLTACRKWGNVEIGRFAFKQAVKLDDKSSVSYISMSHIYAATGLQKNSGSHGAVMLKNNKRTYVNSRVNV